MLRRRALPDGTQGRWIRADGKRIHSTHMGSNEPPYDANNPILREGQPVNEQEYLTDAFTREAVNFIDRHQDRPFFLYLAYNAVHSPLQGRATPTCGASLTSRTCIVASLPPCWPTSTTASVLC